MSYQFVLPLENVSYAFEICYVVFYTKCETSYSPSIRQSIRMLNVWDLSSHSGIALDSSLVGCDVVSLGV
jgi:hypothetical protein